MVSPVTGLALLCFFLADVSGGLGPFLATWLAQAAHWDPARIGLVMTVSGIIGVFVSAPAGALVDRIVTPRLWMAVATLCVLVGSFALLPARGFVPVLAAQILAAAGGALAAPALTALTLGMVGKARFAVQQSRNEAWNHTGNVVAAGVVAAAAFILGAVAAFWVLAGMAAACGATLLVIPRDAIDPRQAHGGDGGRDATLAAVLADRRLLVLGLTLLLFHLGNAAMLPLLGQRLTTMNIAGGPGAPTRWMAACIIVAQLTMIPVAIGAGRATTHMHPVWLLVAACVVLPVRGLIAALAWSPEWLVPIQMLDACGAGLLGVAVPVLVAELTWGTGRTQTALGSVAMLQGIGASLSGALGGELATMAGWGAAFLGLSVPALAALALALRCARYTSRANAASISSRV
jgi:MFS family permease